MAVGLVVAEITSSGNEIFPGMMTHWAAILGSSSPHLTQEVGQCHFRVSWHHCESNLPLSSQHRLDWGAKPEKQALTFHVTTIFKVNPKMSGWWSFQGIFPHGLQPGQTSLGCKPCCSWVAPLKQMQLHWGKMRQQLGIRSSRRRNWKALFEELCKTHN